MVQSSDLARISTVQSTDFLGQSSDLAEDLSKSSSGSEGSFILLCLGVSLMERTVIAFYTIYVPLTDWSFADVSVFPRSPLRTKLDLECRSVAKICIGFHLKFLFYSSSS